MGPVWVLAIDASLSPSKSVVMVRVKNEAIEGSVAPPNNASRYDHDPPLPPSSSLVKMVMVAMAGWCTSRAQALVGGGLLG